VSLPSAHGSATSRLYLELWPDWSPSAAPDLARFAVLVKVAAGTTVDEGAAIEIRLLDIGGKLVDSETTALELGSDPLVGPTWMHAPGRLVRLADSVTQAEAVLQDAVSERVERRDATLAVLLRPVGCHLGLPGEPWLWWCFRNQTADPVAVADILRSTVLWVDGQALTPPAAAYNGPSKLPPQRALTRWWTHGDLDLTPDSGPHRLILEILGARSEEVGSA
jgi:hypothetical protein